MNSASLVLQELRHRWPGALLGALVVSIAVALVVVSLALARAGEKETRLIQRDVGLNVLILSVTGVKGGDLRDMSDKARQRLGSGVVLIVSDNNPKVALLVAVTDDLKDRASAGTLIGELAPIVGGRGGGRPDMAQAGGSEPDKIPAMIATFKTLIEGL